MRRTIFGEKWRRGHLGGEDEEETWGGDQRLEEEIGLERCKWRRKRLLETKDEEGGFWMRRDE
jgi:hypothetical protein